MKKMAMKLTAAALASAMALSGCGGTGADSSKAASGGTSGASADASSSANSASAVSDDASSDDTSSQGKSSLSSPAAVTDLVNTDAGQMQELLDAAGAVTIDDKFRTTYEIFPYSFVDSDGDGIGDINGITSALDYINDGDGSTVTDLGATEIWLTPIGPSTTYHKYDCIDYMAIDPEFGTMDDFLNFLDEAHSRGIRVIIDLVMNHSSSEHPWFVEAAEYLASLEPGQEPDVEECPYVEYYNFSRTKEGGYEPLDLDSYAEGGKANNTDKWYYEARFWSGMPDLNLSNESVRAEFEEIADFWLDLGVDGFRLDAVLFYYTADNASSIEYLTWFNSAVKAKYPDAYIVAECWTGKSTYATYYESGIDSFFDFAFAAADGAITKFVQKGLSATTLTEALESELAQFQGYDPLAVNAPFFTNHDTIRGAGYFSGDKTGGKYKLAQAINLLTTGNAFIYYGEEIGMKGAGKDENKRAPMYWTDGEAEYMTDGPKDMDEVEMTNPSLEEQAADPYSIFNYIRNAIRIRNTFPVIARGNTLSVDTGNADAAAYIKTMDGSNAEAVDAAGGLYATGGSGSAITDYEEAAAAMDEAEDLLVIFNRDDEAVTVELTGDMEGFTALKAVLTADSAEVTVEGGSVTVPGYGVAVLSK